MADDMGYSDSSPYGGEINTPNLEQLASNGLRFTQFYNTARCCPTRASLLTGLYPQQAGIGHMENDRTETKNIAKSHSDQVLRMSKMWMDWAKRTGTVPRPRG